MALTYSKAARALGLGTALAVLTVLVCLAFAASRDPETLTLVGLDRHTQGESLLMSCAEPSSASNDVLWCSDPSSPHCIPAAPEVPRLELWDSPDSCATSGLELPAVTYILLPWPRPEAERLHARDAVARLERPPRA